MILTFLMLIVLHCSVTSRAVIERSVVWVPSCLCRQQWDCSSTHPVGEPEPNCCEPHHTGLQHHHHHVVTHVITVIPSLILPCPCHPYIADCLVFSFFEVSFWVVVSVLPFLEPIIVQNFGLIILVDIGMKCFMWLHLLIFLCDCIRQLIALFTSHYADS